MKKRYLFLLFMAGIVLMNACQKEHSFENGSGPSQGTMQDDGTGDCLPKTVSGAYVAGTALNTNNYIDVQVDVTQIGSYIIYTDTVNGMWFRTSGVFSAVGLTTVRLKGNGTPQTVNIDNFIVHYGTSGCTLAVTTVSTLADFTIDCASAIVSGTYAVGTQLTSSENVTINVTVNTPGAYNVVTTTSDGIYFTSSGIFTTPGPQAIVFTGNGIPSSAGTGIGIPIPATQGSTACSFSVDVVSSVPSAAFTVNCGSAVVNGTYTQGTSLSPSTNTVTIGVNATVAGTYSVIASASGMTFTSSGVLAMGNQNITLAGASSSTPTASGAIPVQITAGTTPCSFTVNVAPGTGGGGGGGTFDWTFTEGANTYQGTTSIATMDVQVVAGLTVTEFGYDGTSLSGDDLIVTLSDISGGMNANETYNTSTNLATFHFTSGSGTTYEADASTPGSSLVFKVTSNNTTTKTISGTFSGNVKDGAGNTKAITNGTFTTVYQ